MADYFVKNPGGLDTNDGLSWATAKQNLSAAAAAAVGVGDRVFVWRGHSETASASRTITGGAPSAPMPVYSAEEGGTPPSAVIGGAQILSSSGGSINMQGSLAVFGLSIAAGSSSSAANINLGTSSTADVVQQYIDSSLVVNSTNGGAGIIIGSSATGNSARSRFMFVNTNMGLSINTQRIEVYQEFIWRGGALVKTSSLQQAVFRFGAQGRASYAMIEGVDFSAMPAATDLIAGTNSNGRVMIRNCVLPAGWVGQLVQGTVDPSLRVEMHNCDSVDTNYRLWVVAFSGTIRSETSAVKADGANDGVTAFAWKIESNANPTSGLVGLESPELARWNETVGAPITVGLDVLSDGDLLTNADAWIEVQYAGNAGLPKSEFINNRVAPLVAPVAHATSSATWNTSGMVKPRSQRLSVTFTPRKPGALAIKVTLAKPNAVLYVDPKVQVS